MYINDSSDGLRRFQNFQFTGSSRLLFTMDVQSLYTSIPHQDGLLVLRFFLGQRPEPSPPTTTLLHLVELVLILNNFSFNSSHFLQVRGVAMGTRMGPSYAFLVFGYVEHSLFQSCSGPHPQLFLRYIDDITGAASLSRSELAKFIDLASNFHPSLTFTWSISDSPLPFLNISVSISEDILATNIHHKPTDSHSYLDSTSSHPASCEDSIPFSQFLRLRCICSDEVNFNKGPSEMTTFFLNRGFPSTIVDRALNWVQPISLSLPSHSSDRVPLILTYHPTSIHIQQIIRCHFRQLQRDATTRHIFLSCPLSAFCRDCSLRDILVHTSFTPTPPQSSMAPSP
eukprot:g33538.t1